MASKQKKIPKRESVPAPKIPDVAAEPRILNPNVQKALDVNVLQAAQKKQWGRVKKLLERGAFPGEEDDLGCSALTYSAAGGQEKLVQMMVDAGVKVSIDDTASRSAFIKAVAGGHAKTADILLEAGKLADGKSIVPPPCSSPSMKVEYVFLDAVSQMMDDEDW